MNTSSRSEEAHIPIKDLRPGATITQHFQLRSADIRKTRSGYDYLELVLGDRTGTIPGKMWTDVIRKCGKDFDAGDFVKVAGRVEVFKERPQVIVERIRKIDQNELSDPGVLVKTSDLDSQRLFDQLIQYALQLEPAELADLVASTLEENAEALQSCQAAKMIHHAYKGGLIEHVFTVTRKVEAILSVEKNIDRNLAIGGAILHDIGKIGELSATNQGRTPEGRLIGHVIIGMDMVRDAAVKKGVADKPWFRELQHIILSHHGETQFGAPVRPLTREAILVHFIDNLDSRLKIMEEALESTDSQGFTSYNKWLEGRVFAGYRALTEEATDD
jgi:3'-5' exoribonuclease